MDMTGEYRIPAPRQRVWEALNDPEVLRQAIPGCEQLDKLSEHELTARVKAKVGPVSATFNGKVTLGDLNPPESYTISGEGSGGVAGFAKGGASVHLAEEGSDTLLRYSAKADVGGKLAQIGSRLIQGTAKKMADDFFGRFSRIVAESYAASAAPAAAMAEPTALGSPMPPDTVAVTPLAPPVGLVTPVVEAVTPAREPVPEPTPTLNVEAAAGGTPPYVPDEVPVQPAAPAQPAAPRPSQFAVKERVPPPSAAPIAPPPAEAGLFQRPLTWVVIAVIVLVLLWYLFYRS